MVVDEWPDKESFQSFFESIQEDIAPIMQAVGAQGEPGVNFWRKLDTTTRWAGTPRARWPSRPCCP